MTVYSLSGLYISEVICVQLSSRGLDVQVLMTSMDNLVFSL